MRSFEAYSQPRMSISVISVSWGGGGISGYFSDNAWTKLERFWISRFVGVHGFKCGHLSGVFFPKYKAGALDYKISRKKMKAVSQKNSNN